MKKVNLVLTALMGCTSVIVEPGQEAVLIEKPLIFGSGGVDPTPVRTGREFAALTTTYIPVDMQPQVKDMKLDDIMSSDGIPLDFHAMIRFQVTNSVELISKFGIRWYESNIRNEFNTSVRQAVRKHGMNETAISSSAVEEIDKEIFAVLTAHIKETGVPIHLLDVTVGKANPPDSIKTQRVETAQQQQRIITEQNRKLAEDSRLDAERSRATADLAYRELMKLAPEQYLHLEEIKMKRDVCAGGKCTFIFGNEVSTVKGL